MSRFEGGGSGGGYDPTAIHKPSGSATPGNLVEWAVNKTVIDSNLSTQTIEDTFTDLQANKADDVDVVHLAGVETITGQKTFTQHPHAPTPNNSDNTTHVATTAFVQSVASAKIEDQIQNNVTDKAPSQNAVFDALALKANDDQVVHLSSAETISGVKTFVSYPEKSATYTAPTTDLQLVPKKWVDDNKMPKQPTAVNNNVPMFNAFGELVDSGKAATLLGTIGDGEVNTFAELPAASTKNGEVWLVKTTTGVIYVNRKVAGLYVSNGTAWTLISPIDVDGYQKLIASAIANNLVKMDANGQVQDAGVALSTLTATNTFDRWVDNVIGSDLYTSNSKLFPYATISKALTGAQYPLKVHMLGQSYTENIALASSQSNITIGAEFCAQSGLQTELNGTITTSSGFTRLRLVNLTINSGTSTPITLASGDLGRHVIDNVSLQTTNASLISIPTNFQNWIDMVGVDVSGASTSVLQLPTLVGTTATLTLKRIKGVLNISAGTNSGWTVYYDSDCVLNWVGGYKGTYAFQTGTPKIDCISVISNNTNLAVIAKNSNISSNGMYVVNYTPTSTAWTASTAYALDQFVTYSGILFQCTTAHTSGASFDPTKFANTNLTGVSQGDIIYHGGAFIHAIFYPFALAPSTINLYSQGTYSKGQTTWQISGSSTWGGITGTLSNQTDLQNALNAKEPTITAGTTSQYYRGDKTFQTLDKTAVGLGNVDNTSDANKPVSTATQTALNLKQDKALTGITTTTPLTNITASDSVLTAFGKVMNFFGYTNSKIVYADSVNGNDSNSVLSQNSPKKTLASAISSVATDGQIYIQSDFTENISFATTNKNGLIIGADLMPYNTTPYTIVGTVTTNTSQASLTLCNLKLNASTSVPFTIQATNSGIYKFDNVSFLSSNAELIQMLTTAGLSSFNGQIHLTNCNFEGTTSTLILPNLAANMTPKLFIKNCVGTLKLQLPSSNGIGWQVYLDESLVNFVGGDKSYTDVYVTTTRPITCNILTNQTDLTTILSSTTQGGYFAVNVASPTGLTGLGKGDIIYHDKVANTNAISYAWRFAPQTIEYPGFGIFSKTSTAGWGSLAATVYGTMGNADYNATGLEDVIVINTDLTTTRTLTLPSASAYNAGKRLKIVDTTGSLRYDANGTSVVNRSVTIVPKSGDSINDITGNVTYLDTPYGVIDFYSDGALNWDYDPKQCPCTYTNLGKLDADPRIANNCVTTMVLTGANSSYVNNDSTYTGNFLRTQTGASQQGGINFGITRSVDKSCFHIDFMFYNNGTRMFALSLFTTITSYNASTTYKVDSGTGSGGYEIQLNPVVSTNPGIRILNNGTVIKSWAIVGQNVPWGSYVDFSPMSVKFTKGYWEIGIGEGMNAFVGKWYDTSWKTRSQTGSNHHFWSWSDSGGGSAVGLMMLKFQNYIREIGN